MNKQQPQSSSESSGDLDRSLACSHAPLVPANRKASTLVWSALSVDLVPLNEPTIDPDFTRMNTSERVIESLRYNVSLLEYRLGANGWVRAWAIATLRMLIFVLLPLIAGSAVLGMLVPAFAAIAVIGGYLETATKSLLLAATYCVLTMAIFAAVISAIKTFRRSQEKWRSGRRGGYRGR